MSTATMRARLVGANHRPAVARKWTYTVTVTDIGNHPLSGTVDTEFAFNGIVIGHETPPSHRLTDGRLRDTVAFPPASSGNRLELQVVVHTHLESATLDWPVTPTG